jgi:hypothetical protein
MPAMLKQMSAKTLLLSAQQLYSACPLDFPKEKGL